MLQYSILEGEVFVCHFVDRFSQLNLIYVQVLIYLSYQDSLYYYI